MHAMAVYSLLLRLFFIFFFVIFVDGCLDDQKKLLLDLKSELIFTYPKANYLGNWNETDDDCCQWESVECDAAGHVITLDLVYGFSGGIGESSSLFRFTYLSKLDLSNNHFTETHIPNQFHRLPNLRHLDLSDSGFMGPIPSTLANLTELVYLDLSSNYLNGSIPSTLSNLTHLVLLDLAGNFLTGSIPSTLANLTHLHHLQLSRNFLTAFVPSFHSCKKLHLVDLSENNLMGSLSGLGFEAFTNLFYVDFSHNSLNGTIPHHLFTLPSINSLVLSNNQFGGQIEEFPIVNISNLEYLDLSSNRLEGHIPNSFFQLQGLHLLDLSHNLFNGTFKLQSIQSLPSLEYLHLSYNKLSVETSSTNWDPSRLSVLHLSACNLYDFPNLTKYSSLNTLDLSNNHIGGDIPSWIWETRIISLNLSLNLFTDLEKPYRIHSHLEILDLHSNQLRCEFPLLPRMFWPAVLLLTNNSLTGVIPTSICNALYIKVLDLSFNNLSGSIPPCLLQNNLVSDVLNLRGNNITGVIPHQFSDKCRLRTFDVSNNNLGGKIPKSLANCEGLVVMNVGNNNFDDTFPCMLPLSLRILVLRSNRFHGDLTCHKSWPNLQILDMSSNNFSGTLNLQNFSGWRGMMFESQAHGRPNHSNSNFLSPNNYYRDEVIITVKRVEVRLVKIWPDFTSIDMSCNNFEGEIPDAIGNLSSLYLLNLSHNAFTNTIPKSLGALTDLGSLDLSANHLKGRIPEELTRLTFLSVLNVSHNHLTGKIPTGPQFQTFQADSFEGNTGLCGFPLYTSCSSPAHGGAITPSKSKDEEIEWDYVFVALGYVVGLGIIAWTLLCCRSLRERYFEKIEEIVDKIFYEPGRKRRHERRVKMRNEVIRRRHQRQRG